MKKQKFELSHDIIAEKIWQRLPEQDKQLRQIQRSLRQRYEDFQSGKGSLLGKAELGAWEIYFPKLDLPDEQQQYIQDSTEAIKAAQEAERERLEKEKAQIARNRRLQKRITWGLSVLGIIIIALLLYSLWANKEANRQSQLAADSQEKADSLLKVAVLADSIARRNSLRARQDSTRAAEAALRALFLTEQSKQDSQRVAELLRSLGMTAQELDVRHGAFLASESRNAFENNNYTLSFRLAQLALQKDENNELAQDILLQVQPYLSDLQLDNILETSALDSNLYIGLKLAGANGEQFQLLNIPELKTSWMEDSLSPAGSPQLSSDKRFLAYTTDGESGTTFRLRDLQNDRDITLNGVQTDKVVNNVFSSDGQYLALSITQQPWPGLFIWDLNREMMVYSTSEGVEDYRFSSGNRYLAVLLHEAENAQLQVWDLAGQKQMLTIDNIPYTRGGSFSFLNSYRFDPCDRYFAALSQTDASTDLEVWDLTTGKLAQRIQNIAYSSNDRYQYRFSFENSFRFNPNCSELAVLAQGDQHIRVELWQPGASKAEFTMNGLVLDQRSRTNYSYRDSYVFSSDGQFFVAMKEVEGERLFQLYELSSYKLLASFPYPATFSFSPGSNYFSIRNESELTIWDLGEKVRFQTFPDVSKSKFSEDGQLLIIEGRDEQLQIWDLNAKKILLNKDQVVSYRFSSGEKYLAIYSSIGAGQDQLEVRARPFAQPRITLNVDQPSFDFNEKDLIAVQQPADVITIYNLQSGQEIRKVFHESKIMAFQLSGQSAYLVSRSENGVLKITNTATRSEEILPYYDKFLPDLSEEDLRLRYGITE